MTFAGMAMGSTPALLDMSKAIRRADVGFHLGMRINELSLTQCCGWLLLFWTLRSLVAFPDGAITEGIPRHTGGPGSLQ